MIDYCIAQDCAAKDALSVTGILDRLKGRQRAQLLLDTYRQAGDPRPATEIGFELTQRAATGEAETRVVVVQDLLNEARALDSFAAACARCPAQVVGPAFGCYGHIPFPFARAAEEWWLAQLPLPEEPLVWLLLKQLLREFHYDGSTARALRTPEGVYFEAESAPRRQLGTVRIDGDQLFEMSFLLGPIQPPHAGVLLLFSGAIDRQQEADTLLQLTSAAPTIDRSQFPFILTENEEQPPAIHALIAFLRALHRAWQLGRPLWLDV